MLGPFVGGFEILCGTLVVMGLLTRLATTPWPGMMAVALTTTKSPILGHQGLLARAQEARPDWSMTLGAPFLLRVGGGPWSADAWFDAQQSHPSGRRVD
jgi:uncharacterized membrane protein YphA (DoxX/SURF4 family)